MKAVARLTLAYIGVFVFFLAAGTSVAVMRAWIDAAQATAATTAFPLTLHIFESGAACVPFAAYASALLVLPHTSRRVSSLLLTALTVFLLTGAALFAGTYGLRVLAEAAKTTNETVSVRGLGSAGLVVELPASTIAFASPAGSHQAGSAVEIVGGSALRVIPSKNAEELIKRNGHLHPLGESKTANAIIDPMWSDFNATARRLAAGMGIGWEALLAYAGGLALLLASFTTLAGSTRWPLADLIICALAYRGAMIFEDVVSSDYVVRFVLSGNFGVPGHFVAPILLGVCGLLIFTGGLIFRLARGRSALHE